MSGKEQESICMKFIDESFNAVEAFIGMYDSIDCKLCIWCAHKTSTAVKSTACGQTFDGAANMSGIYKGCQALIRER